jgi:hypothetical protein
MDRIKIVHTRSVPIPIRYQDYFWDDFHDRGNTSLEKFILRILVYGSAAHIAEITQDYPRETLDIIERYQDRLPVARGLRAFVIRQIRRA